MHCYCSAISVVMLPNRRVNAIETFTKVDFLAHRQSHNTHTKKTILHLCECKRIAYTHICVHLNLWVRCVVVHFSFYDFQLAKHFLHIAFCSVPALFWNIFSYILQDFAFLHSGFLFLTFFSIRFFFYSSLICLQVLFLFCYC